MKSFLTVIALSFLLSACGSGSDAKKVNVKTKRYFVIGDPIKVVSGTELNRNIPNIKTLEAHLSDVKGISISEYHELESANYVNGKRVKPAQSKPIFRKADDRPKETVETYVGHDKYTISVMTQYNEDHTLHFSNSNGNIKFKGFGTEYHPYTNIVSAEILHYSEAKDKSAINFLFYTEYEFDEEGKRDRILRLITFNKTAVEYVKESYQAVDESHQYWWLNNNKWAKPKNIKLDICAKLPEFRNRAKKAIDIWNDNTSVNINYEIKHKYPPFSDLNTNCIYNIHAYTEGYDVWTYGISTTEANEKSFISSDILIFNQSYDLFEQYVLEEDEPEKIKASVENKQLRTLVHEIGHFLGLGHQWEDDHDSVMDYKSRFEKLSQYDIDAVNALYSNTGVKP